MGKILNPDKIDLPFSKDKDGNYIIFKTRSFGGGRVGSRKYKNGYIYFLKIRNMDVYKIGVSNKPSRRIRDIDAGLPFDFDILSLHFFENVYDLEQALMKEYKPYSLKREWFSFPKEIASSIMVYLHNKSIVCQQQ